MNLEKIFPQDGYVLTTKLSAEEVKKRISESSRQKKKPSVAEFHNPLSRQYEDKIVIDTFQINQVKVKRRNSLAPLSTGKINPDTDATNIEIKMELLPFAKTFMSLWFVLTGIACIILLLIGLLQLMQ